MALIPSGSPFYEGTTLKYMVVSYILNTQKAKLSVSLITPGSMHPASV